MSWSRDGLETHLTGLGLGLESRDLGLGRGLGLGTSGLVNITGSCSRQHQNYTVRAGTKRLRGADEPICR